MAMATKPATALTMKVRNTMQTRLSKTRLVILTVLSLLLEGCSISDWYNGYYVERSAVVKEQKKRKAFYNAESPQMKALREQNNAYCLEMASKPENRVARIGFPNGVWNQPMYEQCMQKRGTPSFDAYESILEEKRRAERRARGEIVPENQ